MKKRLLFLHLLLSLSLIARAQIVEITQVSSTSGNAPFGTLAYHGSEYIYSNTEIGNTNFTTLGTAINKIGFSIGTVGLNTTYGTVEIYMKDIPSTTTTFVAGVADPISSYTLVYSGSVTFSTTGFTEFFLTTPYVRAAGTNLQILIKRNDGVTHSGFIFNSAVGIDGGNTTAFTSRRYNGSTAFTATTSMTGSAFRGAIRLKHENPNDASVTNIYTLGKVPLPNAELQTISANITNVGSNTLTNLPVTLDITGANPYTATETIASLAPNASAIVTFPATFFFNTGTNNVSVSVPADDNTANDVSTMTQSVNANTWSYAYGPTPTGGVGFTGATGDFVAKFNTNAATFLSQVSVNFSAGGQPFKIGIWDATGTSGAPGTLLWESTTQTSTAGVFVMPISPAVAVPAGDFYVGVRQTGTTNVSFAFQSETPIRPQTFYYTSPTGTTNWTDFAPNSPFRFMIEPKLILATDASLTAMTINGAGTTSCSSGSQSVDVTISNPGANDIPANSATVYLHIGGSNSYTTSAMNVTNITSGGTETITFSNLPLPNAGTNYDTAYLVLSGDQEAENDTLKITHEQIASVNTYPSIEGFETTPYLFGNVQQLTGTGQWNVQNIGYDNLGFTDSLKAHSGNWFAMFNCWTIASGTSSRLYGTCFDVPLSSGGVCNRTELGFWMSHDGSESSFHDSIYVAISTNGGSSWTRLQGFDRVDAAALVPYWKKETIDLTPYAGQSIRIGFEAVSKFGNAMGLDNVMISSQALQNIDLSDNSSNNTPLVISCEDAGWTYYQNPAVPTENIMAINWDPNSTGANAIAKGSAIPTINVDANYYSNENAGAQEAAYTMRRYWNVNIAGNTLTEPVNVRFFYDSSEIAAMTTAVANFIAANGGTAKTGTWFKTNIGPFIPNNILVTQQGVTNAIPLVNSNTNNSRINGIPYAQFDGITSFSGGTFTTGVGLGSPLEPSFLDISAEKAGEQNRITWTLPGSYAASYFMVERSTDGSNFQGMEKVNATKEPTQANKTYTTLDKNPAVAINYYRVKVVEDNGRFSYSKVVSVKNGISNPISVYPNPAKDQVNISINSATETNATITITDVTGKTVAAIDQTLATGSNKITVALNGFAKGTYVIKMVSGDNTYVQQFSVQ